MPALELRRAWGLCLGLALWLGGCAAAVPAPDEVPGPGPWVLDTLYFGASRGDGGQVSDAEWTDFLDEEVTPRFPDGLTHWKASGQWRDGEEATLKEPCRVLQIAHPRSTEADERLRALTEAYKEKFQQHSVLKLRSSAEPSF